MCTNVQSNRSDTADGLSWADDVQRARQARRAAHLYYVQDLTMDAIARELHTSRSSVSRLLSHARDTGIVRIQVQSDDTAGTDLSRALRERFGVSAHVVPVPESLSDVERLDRVALSAARILTNVIDSNQRVGLAWGATMGAVSRFLVPKRTHGTSFVQLNGSGNVASAGIVYAGELLRRFGDAYDAQVEPFPVPAFFDDPATRDAFWRERSTQRIVALHSRLDVALFSVGSPIAEVPSHVYHDDYLDPSDLAQLREQRVVGDVATVFYRADGSTEGIRVNSRATGPSFAVLRRTPRRVCVVSGPAKVASLAGALAARLVTDLVVDESTGAALLG